MPSRPILALLAASALAASAAFGARAAEPLAPIRLNQVGVLANLGKQAVLPEASATPLDWTLEDKVGGVVLSGQTRVIGPDAASGESLHRIDFSAAPVGDGYRLRVGERASRPFAVAAHPYARLKRDALAFFYQNRSGIPIEARFGDDPKLARPAGHAPDKATCFHGKDERGQAWAGCDYTLDASKGWYDAGDQGKYVVNGGIAVWTLVNYHERLTALGRPDAFGDGTQRIPEAGNGVSDLLDEARWELEFLLAMQVLAGTTMALPVGHQGKGPLALTPIDASGMAHQKLTDVYWTGLPTAPHEDPAPRFLYHPTTGATLNLAAVAAQCARVWKTIDPAFSARCLGVARSAFEAARRNPEIYAHSQFTGGGGYGDPELSDELFWAAAELWATTGEGSYGEIVRASPFAPAAGKAAEAPGWGNTATLGVISLALSDKVPAEVRDAARQGLSLAADRYVTEDARSGYRLPDNGTRYSWGSNGGLMNRAMVLGLAHDFTGKPTYRQAAADAMDYVLGRNPLDQSYVTGWGARPMKHPHHRFWFGQGKYPAPPPGVISGGPNNTAFGDEVARKMQGQCAPQTCWTDDVGAFTQNEVAVNWNAPFFWVAAFLDE
ncbi:glycoside hydrolase family 9 protein [Caulobacter hibisci]|uniref:Endoglucanase n=1 Tax=Caulobacter hibisci TaxID=2035993 RepID=A0ABS0SSC9_9CAUL|nr:glycoside hydrolase family 9 protein [Caulobacter hibisci]MBI1682419.1 glycoside hydrolase family 9 protein [Caulobacter hibisci]